MTTESTNKALVREFHERIMNGKDLAAAPELLAADYVEHNPAVPDGRLEGRDAAVEFWGALFDAFPDLEIDELDLLADGDTVVVRQRGRGTHEGPFLDVEPTGASFDIDGVSTWRIEDGAIAESWVIIDTLGMFQQIGAIPEPGAPPEA